MCAHTRITRRFFSIIPQGLESTGMGPRQPGLKSRLSPACLGLANLCALRRCCFHICSIEVVLVDASGCFQDGVEDQREENVRHLAHFPTWQAFGFVVQNGGHLSPTSLAALLRHPPQLLAKSGSFGVRWNNGTSALYSAAAVHCLRAFEGASSWVQHQSAL